VILSLFSSAEGVLQGDPLGSLEFCLVTNSLIRSFSSELCVGFLDDFTLGGLATKVTDDITNITDKGRQLGLELNASKCEIVCNIQRTVEKFEILRGIIRFNCQILLCILVYYVRQCNLVLL